MQAPRTARCFFRKHPLPRSDRGSAQIWLAVFLYFNAPWFQSYCRAVLESDPALVAGCVKDAAAAINEALGTPNLDEEERDAICIATRYLNLISEAQLQKSA